MLIEKDPEFMDTGAPDSGLYILRHSRDLYAAICEYLIQNGFQDIAFIERTRLIQSNWLNLLELFQDTYYLLRHIGKYKRADTIISIGRTAIPVKLLMKLRLIRCRRFYWFGFFLHSPRSFKLYRLIARILRDDNERYIVFSQWEQSFYGRVLGICPSKLIYVPWGSWDQEEELLIPDRTQDKHYYFSGGASNRDYLSLLDVFRKRSEKLVIVCSSDKNSEVLSVDVTDNIEIYSDIDGKLFGDLVQGAKACILTLKHNTGASGQSVLLRYMRQAKAIVASNTDVVSEYVENGRSGILIEDVSSELPKAIDRLESDQLFSTKLGDAARKRFLAKFSRARVSAALGAAIFEQA